MSEYIEDRIGKLENWREDAKIEISAIIKSCNTTVLDIKKMWEEVERLKCEVRGTEYIDPLTDKPVDQSTEEFVKVVRCRDCKWWNIPNHCCIRWEDDSCFGEQDYCSRGERK